MKTARPILFSGAMIRALLREVEKPGSGKTQTRRIVKTQPFIDAQGNFVWNGWNFGQDFDGPHIQKIATVQRKGGRVGYCPYGKPGDLLWVRETLLIDGYLDPWYAADDAMCLPLNDSDWHYRDPEYKGRIPSIFMPRFCSRITLELTDVRVERVNDITHDDAIAEGIERWPHEDDFAYGINGKHVMSDSPYGHATPTGAFCALWASINGKESWDANPWVWALTFRVINQNVDDYLGQRGDV